MKSRCAAALALTLFALGCVRQDRLRYLWNQPGCFDGPNDPVPGLPNENRDWPSLDCRHRLYKVGFIEFDDDGRTVDPDQETKVLRLIEHHKEAAPGGKVITVIYVHGWRNNASQARPEAKAKDVEKFRSALLELGLRSGLGTDNKPNVPIIGVYVGWRGKSLAGPGWFTFLSYWSRRNTANRVGAGPDLAQTLNRVIDTTNAGSAASRVLLAGHSFGARVLEHAVETGKVRLYDTLPNTGFVNPRVDLLLYVNSANDARLSIARVQALSKAPVTVRHPDFDAAACAAGRVAASVCRPYPLLVSVMSRGDLATKYLLPTASIFNYDKSAPLPPPPVGTFVDRVPAESLYKRSAAGHMPFMHSHAVEEVQCTRDGGRLIAPACAADNATCRFAFKTRGGSSTCYQVHEREGTSDRQVFNKTAFWIMAVDPVVVKDHGDIWNLSFVEMLGELMSPRGFFDPGARRMQLRAAPPGT